MPIMQEGRGKRMPFLFLSPSTQYFNPYVTTGDEFEAEAAGADGYLRLRSYPEPDAEILAQLPNDTPVTVLGNFDTWYTVRADTLYGFAPITEVQLAVMPLTEE